MPEAEIVQTQWWLMECSFPSLNWARLQVYSGGRADVLDMDGRLLTFETQEESRNHLLEDEYVSMESLSTEVYDELQMHPEQLVPPTATSDAGLIPRMFVLRER